MLACIPYVFTSIILAQLIFSYKALSHWQ